MTNDVERMTEAELAVHYYGERSDVDTLGAQVRYRPPRGTRVGVRLSFDEERGIRAAADAAGMTVSAFAAGRPGCSSKPSCRRRPAAPRCRGSSCSSRECVAGPGISLAMPSAAELWRTGVPSAACAPASKVGATRPRSSGGSTPSGSASRSNLAARPRRAGAVAAARSGVRAQPSAAAIRATRTRSCCDRRSSIVDAPALRPTPPTPAGSKSAHSIDGACALSEVSNSGTESWSSSGRSAVRCALVLQDTACWGRGHAADAPQQSQELLK